MKKAVLFVLFLSISLFFLAPLATHFVLAIEGKCMGGAGPQGQFLTREEGGCCLDEECCNYPATQALCNQPKKDIAPFKGIESSDDEELSNDKGKVIGKIEILEGKVEVEQEDGTRKELKVGDEIKFLDHIQVGNGGKVTIMFIDKTPITLLENSYSVIDEFFYDPNQPFLEKTFNKYADGFFSWINEKFDYWFPEEKNINPGAIAGVRG